MTIFHKIDPILVARQVAQKLQDNERIRNMNYFFGGADTYADSVIDKEENHYSTVRIAETSSGFLLVYGNEDTERGTGPFKTKQEAEVWFLNGGR